LPLQPEKVVVRGKKSIIAFRTRESYRNHEQGNTAYPSERQERSPDFPTRPLNWKAPRERGTEAGRSSQHRNVQAVSRTIQCPGSRSVIGQRIANAAPPPMNPKNYAGLTTSGKVQERGGGGRTLLEGFRTFTIVFGGARRSSDGHFP